MDAIVPSTFVDEPFGQAACASKEKPRLVLLRRKLTLGCIQLSYSPPTIHQCTPIHEPIPREPVNHQCYIYKSFALAALTSCRGIKKQKIKIEPECTYASISTSRSLRSGSWFPGLKYPTTMHIQKRTMSTVHSGEPGNWQMLNTSTTRGRTHDGEACSQKYKRFPWSFLVQFSLENRSVHKFVTMHNHAFKHFQQHLASKRTRSHDILRWAS